MIVVGDGVNTAPALTAAEVGIALATRGATASPMTADVVLTVNRIEALGDAIFIARRSHAIAMQSAVLGMGLSRRAIIVSAPGYWRQRGAPLQKVIDVLAIAVALRALLLTLNRRIYPPQRRRRSRTAVERPAHGIKTNRRASALRGRRAHHFDDRPHPDPGAAGPPGF